MESPPTRRFFKLSAYVHASAQKINFVIPPAERARSFFFATLLVLIILINNSTNSLLNVQMTSLDFSDKNFLLLQMECVLYNF